MILDARSRSILSTIDNTLAGARGASIIHPSVFRGWTMRARDAG